MTPTLAEQYSAVVGDLNLLHLEPRLARRVASLQRPNVAGDCLAAVVLALAEKDGVSFDEASVRFRRWCFVGDDYTVRPEGSTRWVIEDADGAPRVNITFR